MTLLLAVALVALQDLAGFLDSLEKDRARGVTSEELLKKLDAWAAGKPEEIVARIAWNRGLIQATIRLDSLFVEGLNKRIGKSVTLGRTTGVIKEVKPDRVILDLPGGAIELMFSSISPDARLDDLKKQQLLPGKSAEEALLRFASGTSVAALGKARAIPPGRDRDRALAAIAGWVLQQADRALAAGPVLKAAEEFATSWAKETDLVAAGGGAIRKFIDRELAARLVNESDAALEKDRKQARKLLDLAASLCREKELAQKISDRTWILLAKGEWMTLPLEALIYRGGTLKENSIAYEDTTPSKEEPNGIIIDSLLMPWNEISGIKARVKPVTTDYMDMRFKWTRPHEGHSVSVRIKEGVARHGHFKEGVNSSLETKSSRKIAKKAEYELVAQWEGRKWKFIASGVEVAAVELDIGDPAELSFMVADGTGELLNLQIRKR